MSGGGIGGKMKPKKYSLREFIKNREADAEESAECLRKLLRGTGEIWLSDKQEPIPPQIYLK